MANGRFLSKSVAIDRRFNNLSLEAAFVYMAAIPHLDRDGLIEGDGSLLWARVCPRRVELLGAMEGIIQEWIAQDLVTEYDYREGRVLWFHGFQKNQKGLRYDREAPSTFPPPPGYIRDPEKGLVPDGSDPLGYPEDCEGATLPEGDSGANPDAFRSRSPDGPEGVPPISVKCKDLSDKDLSDKFDDDDVYHTPTLQGSTHPVTDTHPDLARADIDYTKLPRLAWEATAREFIESFFPDWHDVDSYISSLDSPALERLVGWAYVLGIRPPPNDNEIRSLPGLIKSRVAKRDRPHLTGQDRYEIRRWLLRHAQEVQT